MANIIFCFPPIVSTINSSLRLARELKLRGHQIIYIGIADCEPMVRVNGFEFFSVYDEWFPKGWFENCYLKAQYADDHNFTETKRLCHKFNAFIDHIISGGDIDLQASIQGLNPDLVIISTSGVDSIIWALLMYKMKLKCLYIFDVLGGVVNYTVPPVRTEFISEDSYLSSVKMIGAWQFYRIEKAIIEWYLAWKGVDFLSSKTIKEIVQYCGYPYKEVQFLTDMPSPQLKLPELVLCPLALEFPGANRPRRYYAEASIDLERVQASFPWEKFNNTQPIIYVALGTLPQLKNIEFKKFFITVIEASKKLPKWNWVLSIGNNLSVDDFKCAPSNVIIVNRAPQLEILKKSSVMITHGGANSVKECIFFGVPMIVFPLSFDEFGNASRVTYHNLGVKGNFKKITSKELNVLIENVINNSNILDGIKLMQQKFIYEEALKPSVQIVEKFLVSSVI